MLLQPDSKPANKTANTMRILRIWRVTQIGISCWHSNGNCYAVLGSVYMLGLMIFSISILSILLTHAHSFSSTHRSTLGNWPSLAYLHRWGAMAVVESHRWASLPTKLVLTLYISLSDMPALPSTSIMGTISISFCSDYLGAQTSNYLYFRKDSCGWGCSGLWNIFRSTMIVADWRLANISHCIVPEHSNMDYLIFAYLYFAPLFGFFCLKILYFL